MQARGGGVGTHQRPGCFSPEGTWGQSIRTSTKPLFAGQDLGSQKSKAIALGHRGSWWPGHEESLASTCADPPAPLPEPSVYEDGGCLA